VSYVALETPVVHDSDDPIYPQQDIGVVRLKIAVVDVVG
jgi:hypothetical protein